MVTSRSWSTPFRHRNQTAAHTRYTRWMPSQRAGCGTAHIRAYGHAPYPRWSKREPGHRIPTLLAGNRRFPLCPWRLQRHVNGAHTNHVPMSARPGRLAPIPTATQSRLPVLFPRPWLSRGKGVQRPSPQETQGGARLRSGRMWIPGALMGPATCATSTLLN